MSAIDGDSTYPDWNWDQLRWYLLAEEPRYITDPWWLDPNATSGQSKVNMEDDRVTSETSAGRPEIRLAPLLWEILRRHPDLCSIRKEFLGFMRPSTHEHLAEFHAFLDQFGSRGRGVFHALFSSGHLPWSSSGGSVSPEPNSVENVKELPKGCRSRFQGDVSDFLSNRENFRGDTRVSPDVTISNLFQDPFRLSPYQLPTHEYAERMAQSLENLAAEAAARGNALLAFEVDKQASSTKIVDAFKRFLAEARNVSKKNGNHTEFRRSETFYESIADLDANEIRTADLRRKITRLFAHFRLQL